MPQPPDPNQNITVITRYERGAETAYSIDEGETYHPTVRQAFEHRDGVITAVCDERKHQNGGIS